MAELSHTRKYTVGCVSMLLAPNTDAKNPPKVQANATGRTHTNERRMWDMSFNVDFELEAIITVAKHLVLRMGHWGEGKNPRCN
jgi:hypothetical protein